MFIELFKYIKYSWIVLIIIGVNQATAFAQGSITANLDKATPSQGDSIVVSLNIDGTSNIYYFEAEVSYEPDFVSFKHETAGDLMGSNSISVADNLSYNKIGVSASRTSGSGSGPGTLVKLVFNVNANADTTNFSFSFSNIKLKDKTGAEISVTSPSDISATVKPAITNTGLLSGAETIHEAQTIELKSSVYAYTITNDAGQGDGISVWMGLNDQDSDPATWDESKWEKASYVKDQQDSDIYSYTFGPGLSIGDHYYAVRVQLENGNYQYGGYDGSGASFWDGQNSNSGVLTVNQRPRYHTKLAEWNFDDQDLVVDRFIAANKNIQLNLNGAEFDSWDDDNSNGFAAKSSSWDHESGKEKYFSVQISTSGFENMTVSSEMSGTGSGPAHFKLQYSLDNTTWAKVSDDTIKVGEGWDNGILNNKSLPTELDNKDKIYLRWLKNDDIRVDGDSGVSSIGKLTFDDIIIRGVDMNPDTVKVNPGDANNDQIVDESDVLPLGTYWQYEGQSRIFQGTNWAPVDAAAWHPKKATYADTDGNGQVNQSDLQAIGMNFSKTVNKAKMPTNVHVPLTVLPKLKKGETITVYIDLSKPERVMGFSWSLHWENLNQDYFEILSTNAWPWSKQWPDNDMLSMHKMDGNNYSGALVHKGKVDAHKYAALMKFKIRALKNWPKDETLWLKKVNIVNSSGDMYAPKDVQLRHDVITANEREAELPKRTSLEPNYPNPFNPQTMISYKIAHKGMVNLTVFDVQGRKVATLVKDILPAGTYNQTWDATKYSSGVYLYRLKVGNYVRTRKMVLIK